MSFYHCASFPCLCSLCCRPSLADSYMLFFIFFLLQPQISPVFTFPSISGIFFLPFSFVILLLHPSADHLSWEAAGWRWAYIETKLLISTTVCAEETLLTEESNSHGYQVELSLGTAFLNETPGLFHTGNHSLTSSILLAAACDLGSSRAWWWAAVLHPVRHMFGSVHVFVSCRTHQEDMLFNSQLPSRWLCGSCQMACHHKTMAYD